MWQAFVVVEAPKVEGYSIFVCFSVSYSVLTSEGTCSDSLASDVVDESLDVLSAFFANGETAVFVVKEMN